MWDGRALLTDLKGELEREYQRLGVVKEQLRALGKVQDERLEEAQTEAMRQVGQLMSLCGMARPAPGCL